MLAMDVVDTLRHRRLLVDRELEAEDRRERLVERLREIYAAQGIDVNDAVLFQGVMAMEEDRFAYTPPANGFSTWLAGIYVSRSRWGKPLLALVGIVTIVLGVKYFAFDLSDARRQAALPAEIDNTFARIVSVSEVPEATARAQTLLDAARRAIDEDDHADAQQIHVRMKGLFEQLSSSYDVGIVSRPNQFSGVWRIPDTNPNARNYYLIVEAIGADGKPLSLPIKNEEDGKTRTVELWGIRVGEETFQNVAADKQDDGIIQDNIVGNKARGQLEPTYIVSTSGATITEW